MRNSPFLIALAIALAGTEGSPKSMQSEARNVEASTDIPAGPVSGIWVVSGSPYHINGEITIPNDSTLTIDPGVEVLFMGHYKFNVQGRLIAVGTAKDTIKFDAVDTNVGWHGIRFANTPSTNDTSEIVFCSLKHGMANTGAYNGLDRCGGAIFIRGFSKVLVSHCLFDSNMNNGDIAAATGGACIYIANASPIIMNSTFVNNVGTTDCAILSWYSNVVISKNFFLNNSGPHGPVFCAYNAPIVSGNILFGNVTTRAGGGIFTMTSNALVTNNIIVYNSCFGMEGEAGGVKCWIGDKSVFINNTIAYNSAAHGGGICCNSSSHPLFFNCIVWGNTSPDGNQVNLVDAQSDPLLLNCDIQGGKEGFAGGGAGKNYSGLYEGNIDLDPLFRDTASADYGLLNPSHCIGAGVDSVWYEGLTYYAPPFDIHGIPRPSPTESRPDIGACESDLPTPDFSESVRNPFAGPSGFALYQNYPNPFNPTTRIRYTVGRVVAPSGAEGPASTNVRLVVHDLLGREVAELANGRYAAGTYSFTFDGSGLASGIYFYRLTAGSFSAVRKMALVK